jgi:hypothetical protein
LDEEKENNSTTNLDIDVTRILFEKRVRQEY